MDAQKVAQIATLIGTVVSLLSVITGFILSKRKDRESANSKERELLSADQKVFVDHLKSENKDLRERLDKLTQEFYALKEAALKDRLEKEHLAQRVAELEQKIEGNEESN